MTQSDENKAKSLKEVYQDEWAKVRARREKQFYVTPEQPGIDGQTSPEGMVGLALSGGGIRSATFCLGILQGLQKLNLLRIFDYLSTVSGGGYVGGWWSAWLSCDDAKMRQAMESPRFTGKQIKKTANMALRFDESDDPVSKQIREEYNGREDTHLWKLMADFKDQGRPVEGLKEALAKELNIYLDKEPDARKKMSAVESLIKKSKLSVIEPSKCQRIFFGIERLKPEPKEVKIARWRVARVLKRQFRWLNRYELEEAYPYELRGIFPDREKIEAERLPKALIQTERRITESSITAWADPIHHLRLFANYLTPRRGLLSADTWRAISVIIRNLTLTWLILLPLLIAVMVLGQLYIFQTLSFLGGETKVQDFIAEGNAGPGLMRILPLPLALLGWIIALGVVWLMWNKDENTIADWIVQIGSLCMLILLIFAGLNIFIGRLPPSQLNEKRVLALAVAGAIWLIILGCLLFYSLFRKISVEERSIGDPGLRRRWIREVRRNRISRMQTRLMIALVIVSAVLLLSGYSHVLINRITNIGGTFRFVGLLPLVSAIAGSIFTAFKASPSGGGDKHESRGPSKFSRIIFAVTPGLVVSVLALLVAAMSHALLGKIYLLRTDPTIQTLLTLSAFFAISLCVLLAFYEMSPPNITFQKKSASLALEWKKFLPFIIFGFLIIINLIWGLSALVHYFLSYYLENWAVHLGVTSDRLTMIMALLVSLGIVATIINFLKLPIPKLLKKYYEDLRRTKMFVWALTVILIVVAVSAATILIILKNAKTVLSTAYSLQFGLAVLASSFILFRLLVVRRSNRSLDFELRWFKGTKIGQSVEALWVLAALCLALPVAITGWIHALSNINRDRIPEGIALFVSPMLIALLPAILILFRILVIEIWKTREPEERESSVVGKFVDSIPKVNSHKKWALRLLAIAGIGVAVLVGFTKVEAGGRMTASIQALASPANLVQVGIILFLIPLFKSAVGAIPVNQSSNPSSFQSMFKLSGIHQGRFIWLLATFCVLLAVLDGYLINLWLIHVKQWIPGDTTNILSNSALGASNPAAVFLALPGMVACLMFIVFEMLWGSSDNRRSIWLMLCAYAGLSLLFSFNVLDKPWYDTLTPLRVVLGFLAAILVWIVALGWMVDPNAVSMHQFYKARLVRAYLGASNVRRLKQGKEVTEAVAGDDLPLNILKNCQRGGPHHLINTTLNLVAGRDLATSQRSAASFILSQSYCGSSRTHYQPTDKYMGGRLSLGTAIAASGAAVSPSMGSKKPTAALAMLMTLLNVRLGYWAPTPNKDHWNSAQPRLWPFYLLREFLSQTNDLSSYCYLTDGGHFDNTGLYSLVERGCRFIVIVDCGADPQPSCFEDLGEAIRRCRIDFGTEIKLCIDSLIRNREKKAEGHFAVGGIRYSRKHANLLGWSLHNQENSREDKDLRTGVIVYFKPVLVGDETPDVRQYGLENKYFPQQTTANQWFDEAQFESYRRLGQLSTKSAFGKLKAVEDINKKVRLAPEDIGLIFQELVESMQGSVDDSSVAVDLQYEDIDSIETN
jgi:hypothetical protein